MIHGLAGALLLIGAGLVGFVVLIVVGLYWERQEEREKQARQRPIGLMDELEFRARQRYRKSEVRNLLRETARQARRPGTSVDRRGNDRRIDKR